MTGDCVFALEILENLPDQTLASTLKLKNPMPSKQKIYTRQISRWGEVWGVADLPERITITLSTRLKKTLGRVRPMSGVVTLNAKLASVQRSVFLEVLCHEVAHVVAYILHGSQAKPRGPEWRALVSAVGYKPSTSMNARWLPDPATEEAHLGKREHYRCSVCQADYFVSRRSSHLYCEACIQNGVTVRLHFISHDTI